MNDAEEQAREEAAPRVEEPVGPEAVAEESLPEVGDIGGDAAPQQAFDTVERLMGGTDKLPEIKQIVGALLFASKVPMTARQMRRIFVQVAELRGGLFEHFAGVKEKQIEEALADLNTAFKQANAGFSIHEVAGGLRLQNDLSCGPWVRELLEKGKPNRLSRPALETLAIIAYRQPCPKSEIEGVRGVAVDAILKRLLEMQLVRITGRSELPGRPLLFGTTQRFLEHFGLKTLDDMPGVSELRRVQQEKEQMDQQAKEAPEGELAELPEE